MREKKSYSENKKSGERGRRTAGRERKKLEEGEREEDSDGRELRRERKKSPGRLERMRETMKQEKSNKRVNT